MNPNRLTSATTALVVAFLLAAVGCSDTNTGSSSSSGGSTSSSSGTSGSSTSGSSGTAASSGGTTASSGGTSGRASACALPAYPNPTCTGVPPGTSLTVLAGDYTASTPGERIEAKHITGDLVIKAANVTVVNSQIDGTLINEVGTTHYGPFTVTDSTVGPSSGCITSPGVGESNYVATRVLIRGHDDGFRVSGDHVAIYDSYVKLCSNPGSHSDGVQAYMGGADVLVQHNTFDQRDAPEHSDPINLTDPQLSNVRVFDNLVAGGNYSLFFHWYAGPNWPVSGNKIVDHAWDYAPASMEGTCAHIDWGTGNAIVTVDADYRIASTVSTIATCPD